MDQADAPDMVNHPPHYKAGGIETIDFILAKCLSYLLGNVVKYVSRAGLKNDKLEDLRKAQWYLNRAIEELVQEQEQFTLAHTSHKGCE